MQPYDGEIEVGDQFEWNPYGHPAWPNGNESIKVVAIIGYGGERTIVSVNTAHVEPATHKNTESFFREHVKKWT